MTVRSKIVVELDASGVPRGVRQVKSGLNEIDQTTRRTDATLKRFGAAMAGYFSFELVSAGLSKVFNETRKFDSALRGLSSITGIQGSQLDSLGKNADVLSRRYGIAAADVLGLSKQLASLKPELAGNAEGLAKITESAVLLNKAQTDLSATMAAEAIGSTLNAYSLGVEEAARVTDMLAEASRLGAREVPFVAEGLQDVGALASTLGEDLQTPIAALEVLGQNMDSGAQAGTHLRNIFTRLVKDASDSGREFQGLHAELERLAEGGFEAEEALGIFGEEVFNSAIHLVNNREAVLDLSDALSNSLGAASKQAETNMGGIDGSVAKLQQAVNSLMRSLGDSSAFTGFINHLTEMAEGLELLLTDMGLIEDKYKSQQQEIDRLNQKMKQAQSEYNHWAALAERALQKTGQVGDTQKEHLDAALKSYKEAQNALKAYTAAIEKEKQAQEDAAKASEEKARADEEARRIEEERIKLLEEKTRLAEEEVAEILRVVELEELLARHKAETNKLYEENIKYVDEVIELDFVKHLEAQASAEEKLRQSTRDLIKELQDVKKTDEEYIQSLRDKIDALGRTEIEQQKYEAVSNLSKLATAEQRAEVELLVARLSELTGQLNETGDANQRLNDSMRQFRSGLANVSTGFFEDLATEGEDAWGNMLDNMTDMLVQTANSEWADILSGQRGLGSTGSGGMDVVNGIGAGLQWGQAGAVRYGQGTEDGMLYGAALGAIQGGATGGFGGALAGALVGAFTAGQKGQWEMVGQHLSATIQDGVLQGMMITTEQRFKFGSREMREVFDALTPDQQGVLDAVFGNFMDDLTDSMSSFNIDSSFADTVMDSINSGFRVAINENTTTEDIMRHAMAQFQLGVSAPIDAMIPGLRALSYVGERAGETFIRVGKAIASVEHFFDLSGFNVDKLIDENFGDLVVQQLEQIDFSAMEAELAGLQSQLQDAISRGASQEEQQTIQDEIQEVMDALANWTDEWDAGHVDVISAVTLGREAWMAAVQDYLGGFEEMNSKFADVLNAFFDGQDLYLEALEKESERVNQSFTRAVENIGDLATGIDSGNFGQFLREALSGALGVLDPETFAAIIDAGSVWLELSNAEQELALARGEVRDITTLTADQIKQLNEIGLEWQKTLNLMGHEFTMARGEVAEFILGVVDLTGGLDAANGKFQAFVETFFTAEEQFELLSGQLSSAAEEMGLALDDLDTREEVSALFAQAMRTGNEELAAFLLNWGGTIDEFISSLDGVDGSADGATNAIDETSRALEESVAYWGQIGSAISSALDSVRSSIASLRSARFSTLGLGATGAGSISGAIGDAYGLLGEGSIEDQIGNIQNLHDLIMQRYQMEAEQIQANSQASAAAAGAVQDNSAEEAAARKRAHEEAMSYWERMSNVARSLRAYIDQLKTGEYSSNTPEQRLEIAQLEFERLLQLALGGDADAAEQLQGSASTLLDLAREYFASSAEFDSIFDMVVSGLEQVADMAAGVDKPPAWVEPVTSAISGSIGASSSANSAALAQLQSATIAELEKLEEELKRLQEIQKQEEEAAKQRLADYHNNTEAYQAEIANNTAGLADMIGNNGGTIEIPIPGLGGGIEMLTLQTGDLLINSFLSAQHLEEISGNIEMLDDINTGIAELPAAMNFDQVVAAIEQLEGRLADLEVSVNIDESEISGPIANEIANLRAEIAGLVDIIAAGANA